MEKIELLKIFKSGNLVEYNFSCSEGLLKFFTGRKFKIYYPVVIDDMPDSVLVVPFLSNLIQLAWITNSTIVVPSIDGDFFRSLPRLKKALSNMFPETQFEGELSVNSVEENIFQNTKLKSAMFFSGGVDSYQTLISHHQEDVDLLTIWGSDINYGNEEGWNVLFDSIRSSAEPFNLNIHAIHSSFRDVFDEKVLYKEFSNQLKDSWWHGIQHGAGLLGHVAPLAFKFGYKKMYIASSHSTHDANVRCSSHPTTDNSIKFCGCQVVHDGFEFRRQNKIKNIVDFSKKNPTLPINLHVCWKTQSGENCCACEKCARTVYSILVEGGDPKLFGFPNFKKALNLFDKKHTFIYLDKHPHIYHHWFDIADRIKELKTTSDDNQYWKYIRWVGTIDRNNKKSYRVPRRPIRELLHRILNKASRLKNEIVFSNYLKKTFKNNKSVFLLGTPTHCNIGDAAIAQAEINFIKSNGYKTTEITVNEWKKYKKIIKKKIKNRTILLHGGGNFGNLWPTEESVRRDIITSFPNNHFILLPQTFYLTKSFSNEDLAEMQNIYNRTQFSLFAREKMSFGKMTNLFPLADCFLTPDIVLYETNKHYYDVSNVKKTIDILMILRSDREGLLDYDDYCSIKKMLEEEKYSYRFSDMLHYSATINKSERKTVVLEKLKEFASSRVVITDRLHGMIFAYLANVPCIVLQNNNYKIIGVYDWIKDSGNIFLADKPSDLKELIKSALALGEIKNSFDENAFDNLKVSIFKGDKDANR